MTLEEKKLDDIKLTDMKFVVLDTETTGPTARTEYKIKKEIDGTKKFLYDFNGEIVKDKDGMFVYDYELDENGKKIVEKEQDKVIEYASILFDMKTKTFSESIQMFFDPGILIPPQAMSVHHITNEMVKGKPQLDKKMLEHIKKTYLKDYVKVAYNSNFDSGIMNLDNYGTWIDAYRLAMKTWHIGQKNEDGFELSSFKQQELRYWLKLPEIDGDAHRADFDIKITSLVLERIIDEYLKNGHENSWKAFKRFHDAPIKHLTMPFGSANIKGKKLNDLNLKELDWICNPKSPMFETYKKWDIIDNVNGFRAKLLLENLSNGTIIIPKATSSSYNKTEQEPKKRKRKM